MPKYDAERYAPPAPLATVELRHPEHAEVSTRASMLIDSGADVTLAPRSAVAGLGLPATGESYQLVGFDGSISEAEAVRVDLVFVGRRFRGKLLLTDAEVGVLGRDILNHIRLILDGPARSWDEHR